jgi:hypothetical protein
MVPILTHMNPVQTLISYFFKTQLAPNPMVTGALSLGVKRPGRESDHSSPSSAEVKNTWSYTSITLYVFMEWCLMKQGISLHGIVLS